MRLVLCILYLVRVIQASDTPDSASTSDGSETPSCANHRTLWNIVSTCALTIFACTYSAMHVNIPSPKDSPVRVLLRRAYLILFALFVPELLVAWAMRQWLWARHISAQFKHLSARHPQERPESDERIEVPESYKDHDNTQACGDNEGCKGTRTLAKRFKEWFKAYTSDQFEDYAWTQTHSFFALMGGFMLYVDDEPYHILLPNQLLSLVEDGSIDLPRLTAKQIHDRSKGNAISKGLIVLQVASFILQLISRGIYHLEITLFEVGTLAFAVLNFITYAVWWNKPLDVQCSHPVYWKSTKAKLAEVSFDGVSERDLPLSLEIIAVSLLDSTVRLAGFDTTSPQRLRVAALDGDIKLDPRESDVLTFAGFVMGTTFGAIHCAAWLYPFPTYPEQVLWRASAIYITFAQWFHLLVYLLFIPKTDKKKTLRLVFIAFFPGIVSYIAARSILFILMFTTLRSLHADIFKAVSWANLVPHL